MSTPTSPVSVLIVDDHYIVRMGLAALIKQDPRMVVAGEAEDGPQTLQQVRLLRPDVVLLDLRLPGMDGVETCEALRLEFPQARVLILTTFGGDENVYRALKAGARGYILKKVPGEELLEAIWSVHHGGTYIPAAFTADLAQRMRRMDLSEREMQVLQLVSDGLSNKEISTALNISAETAKHHLKNVFMKLGVNDRTQAVTAALRHGVLHIEPS